jgi:hypothetical protein
MTGPASIETTTKLSLPAPTVRFREPYPARSSGVGLLGQGCSGAAAKSKVGKDANL